MGDQSSWPDQRLASVIDGITLAAQSETNLQSQMQMERFAARLLTRGLAKAEGGALAA